MRQAKEEVFDSIWDAIATSSEESANLKARAELIHAISAVILEAEWTQSEAARRCGVSQPRINDLLRGRIQRFSLDALVNLAAALGLGLKVVPQERSAVAA